MCFFVGRRQCFCASNTNFGILDKRNSSRRLANGCWVWKKGKTLRRTHRPHPRRGNQAITPISVFGVCGPYDIIKYSYRFYFSFKEESTYFIFLDSWQKKINTPDKLRAHTTPLFPHTIHTREIILPIGV